MWYLIAFPFHVLTFVVLLVVLALNSFCHVFLVFNLWYTMEIFFSGLFYLVFWMLLVMYVHVFQLVWGNFLLWSWWKIVLTFIWDSSQSPMTISKMLCFFTMSHFFWILFLYVLLTLYIIYLFNLGLFFYVLIHYTYKVILWLF